MTKEEILGKLQALERGMIKDFASICEKHDIKWFVIFGTALGAIRHQGFIPWDDDVDIGLLREDYNKLCEIPKEEWEACSLFLGKPDDDLEYHEKVFPKIYKKDTVFCDEYTYKYDRNKKGERIFSPIWIDIFIYDDVCSYKKAKSMVNRVKWSKRNYHFVKLQTVYAKGDSLKTNVANFIRRFFHFILNVSKRSEKKIYNNFLKKVTKNEGAEYVADFCCLLENEQLASFTLKKDLFPLRKVKFDDIEVYIQNNCEQMLERNYGDYMTPPPKDKQETHIPYILDFGNGEVYDMRNKNITG